MELIQRRLAWINDPKKIAWFLLAYGILLRIRQYLANRSLTSDEAKVAMDILSTPFPQLFQPIGLGQPVGFLLLEKLFAHLLGGSEYALRLYPLTWAIIGLFLFYYVAHRYLSPWACILALGLFVISEPLIYYASEVKQYSSDATLTVLLYALFSPPLFSKRFTLSRMLTYGFIGSMLIWFSHPVVFVLIGLGTSICLICVQQREWGNLGRLFGMFLFWGISFGLLFVTNLNPLTQDPSLTDYWLQCYVPFLPTSIAEMQWFILYPFALFSDTAGFTLAGVAAVCFLTGSVAMFVQQSRWFLFLVSPWPFVIGASMLHKYPFCGRLLVFLIPCIVLLIAFGADFIRQQTVRTMPYFSILLIGFLLLHPVLYTAKRLIIPVYPNVMEDSKPVLSYIQQQWQEGDRVYIYHSAKRAFRYYGPRYGFAEADVIYGVDPQKAEQGFIHHLQQLQGYNRMWILFSHFTDNEKRSEEHMTLLILNSMGQSLDSVQAVGASGYLYNFAMQQE